MWVFTLYAALTMLLLLALSINISRLRVRHQVSFGHGDIEALRRAIRAHANLVEHGLPVGLLVLALVLEGANEGAMLALVLAFLLTRLLHAAGMLAGVRPARRSGAGLTYLLELVASLWALLQIMN
ncbi:MAG TPA: MAPEG family protein [Gammaproteobacteria bacterium]|nr:MAPEG family protein [Gammaproteobacteria bacterium]